MESDTANDEVFGRDEELMKKEVEDLKENNRKLQEQISQLEHELTVRIIAFLQLQWNQSIIVAPLYHNFLVSIHRFSQVDKLLTWVIFIKK